MNDNVLLRSAERIVVRGHVSAEYISAITGRCAESSASVRHVYWRHAFTPYSQHQLFQVARSRYVEAKHKGPGAFPVTVLDLRVDQI